MSTITPPPAAVLDAAGELVAALDRFTERYLSAAGDAEPAEARRILGELLAVRRDAAGLAARSGAPLDQAASTARAARLATATATAAPVTAAVRPRSRWAALRAVLFGGAQ